MLDYLCSILNVSELSAKEYAKLSSVMRRLEKKDVKKYLREGMFLLLKG